MIGIFAGIHFRQKGDFEVKKFLLFMFLTLVLFAGVDPIKSDFEVCKNKNRISFVKIGRYNAVAVSKHTLLFFSKRYIRGYIKRDPFLGLYLFKYPKELKPVKFTEFAEVKKNIGIIGDTDFDTGEIVSLSNGLDISAKINKKAKQNSLIECVCCRAFGLSNGGYNFIDSDFIIRFLAKKRVSYAESGLKFEQKGSHIYVKEKNPFLKHLYIPVGSMIIKIDGKKFDRVSTLSKYILFSKIGKVIDISYKYGKKIYHQKIKLKRKITGGLIPQTYLESIGLWINYKLRISYIVKNSLAQKLGLKKGDKLLKINKNFIKSYSQIKKVLSKIRDKQIYLLLSRNDFQFFVHFRR